MLLLRYTHYIVLLYLLPKMVLKAKIVNFIFAFKRKNLKWPSFRDTSFVACVTSFVLLLASPHCHCHIVIVVAIAKQSSTMYYAKFYTK